MRRWLLQLAAIVLIAEHQRSSIRQRPKFSRFRRPVIRASGYVWKITGNGVYRQTRIALGGFLVFGRLDASGSGGFWALGVRAGGKDTRDSRSIEAGKEPSRWMR